ncbi:hypothetical protein [Spirosoma migulaei]
MARYQNWKVGEGDNERVTTIASDKLSVPTALWKMIVALPGDLI